MKDLFYEKQLKRLVHDMSDERGLIQHAQGAMPLPLEHGYSIDDVARGLVVLSRTFPRFDDKEVHNVYLEYIKKAQKDNGLFHNFYESKNGRWEWREEQSYALQDCFGRVMWALSEFTGSQYPEGEKKKAEKMFLEHLEFAEELVYEEHITSKAFTLLGLSDYVMRTGNSDVMRVARNIAESLAEKFHENKDNNKGWMWFSDKMTYCNPKLPHPMIIAGYVFKDREIFDTGQKSDDFSPVSQNPDRLEEFCDLGKSSLDFLISKSFDETGVFHAIGNNGWYKKGGEPAKFDQQTVEAGDMVETCIDAYKILGHEKYKGCARKAFEWFNGKNITGKSMIDPLSGGVYDAITENGINVNQGAESILSYLLAATKLEELT